MFASGGPLLSISPPLLLSPVALNTLVALWLSIAQTLCYSQGLVLVRLAAGNLFVYNEGFSLTSIVVLLLLSGNTGRYTQETLVFSEHR